VIRITPVTVIAGLVGIALASTALGSFYTVDQKERSVLTRNGKVIGIAQPGLGWKVPFIDGVVDIPVTTKTVVYDNMNAYSADQQPADMKVSVTVHANPEKVDQLYSRFGSVDAYMAQRVSPVAHQQVKIVFGGYTAVKAIQNRGALNSAISDAIEKAADEGLVVIESVQLENIDFSKTYIQSIEQRMLAEVAVQKVQQDALKEKETAKITVTRAQAEADSTFARADAEAKSIRLKGDAEADAIKARAAALGQNPLLIELTKAEKWKGDLPTTMIPGSAVPFINIK
jgi:regulator of protease activity HflC (stomatin/prohibitin superfamily)